MAIPENDNQLWAGFNDHGLYAKRAERDKNGNPIDTTYATKDTMVGATAQGAGEAGLVPAPTAGDQAKFLKGDGTWATPPEANLANYATKEDLNAALGDIESLLAAI